MKKSSFTYDELSVFCLQTALSLHAGISPADGMHLMAEEEKDENRQGVYAHMAERLDDGISLSEALKSAEAFPEYMVTMAAAGERTGRTEQAFRSMADYYDGRRQLKERLTGAVMYPMIVFALMLAVIVVLLVKVLPVFRQVYEQLGGSMSGFAGGLFMLGRGIEKVLPAVGIICGALLGAVLVIYLHPVLNKKARMRLKRMGTRGRLGREIGEARFAAALAMGLQSGLTSEEALQMASFFQKDDENAVRRYEQCMESLAEGAVLSAVFAKYKVFEPVFCRMLALGEKSGTADSVMGEISRRLEERVQNKIEDKVSKIEPGIVIAASLAVGVVLLAVMLPLMNIMTTIG